MHRKPGSQIITDQPPQAVGASRGARTLRLALIGGALLLLVAVIGSAVAGLGWVGWLLDRGWLLALAVLVLACALLVGYDRMRPKNIAWRELRARYGEALRTIGDRSSFGTGPGLVGAHRYFGLRSFGSPEGLEIGRIIAPVNPPLYIPWSAIAKIDTFPNLLTGRQGFESDMQAQLSLRDDPELTIEVPWLKEYRQLLPKSVKYRSIKLSKK